MNKFNINFFLCKITPLSNTFEYDELKKIIRKEGDLRKTEKMARVLTDHKVSESLVYIL